MLKTMQVRARRFILLCLCGIFFYVEERTEMLEIVCAFVVCLVHVSVFLS